MRQAVRYLPWFGAVAVVVVSWTTSEVRDPVDLTNVALVVAAITVATAAADWRAGLVTSVVAAFSLNYFHTDPVRSFRIADPDDLASVLLLGAIGLGVTAVSAARRRADAARHAAALASTSKSFLAASAGTDAPVDAVWRHAAQASCERLALVECRIDADGDGLPLIARLPAAIDGDTSFLLPASGAAVEFRDPRRRPLVVLTPRSGQGALSLDRRAVMAFVDQIDLALEPTPPGH